MAYVSLLTLPCNKSLFSKIRRNNNAYVDKTMFIELLEKYQIDYPFIIRPRRFGKTLFVNTLADYYDKSKADQFDELFSGTYIHDHKTPSQGKYRVLRFNFSGLIKSPNLMVNFTKTVLNGIKDFLRTYPYEGIPLNYYQDRTDDPASIFRDFCSDVVLDINEPDIYIIIDEYDQFANEILSQDDDVFRAMTSEDGFLKTFYAAIKDGTDTVIDKVFITGVTSVSLDSISSGFNIATNLSDKPAFASMFGFTSDELLTLINKTVDLEKYGHTAQEILSRMKDLYNGYRFSRKSEVTVFNPSMCLDYLQEIVMDNAEPDVLFDSSANMDITKVEGFMKLSSEEHFKAEICQRALTDRPIHMDALPASINMNKIKKFNRNELLSIFLYMGFLTWSGQGTLDLCCPNKAVKEQFFRYFFRSILEGADFSLVLTPELKQAYLAMHDGEIRPYLEYVSLMMGRNTGFHALSKFSEMVVQAITQSLCLCTADFKATSDAESLGQGYYDLLIEENTESNDRRMWLIEFKYLGIAEGTGAAVERKFNEAMSQVQRYASSEQFSHLSRLKYGVAVFVGTKLAKTSF